MKTLISKSEILNNINIPMTKNSKSLGFGISGLELPQKCGFMHLYNVERQMKVLQSTQDGLKNISAFRILT